MKATEDTYGVQFVMECAKKELQLSDGVFEDHKPRWRQQVMRYMTKEGLRKKSEETGKFSYQVSEAEARRVYSDLRPYFYASRGREAEWGVKRRDEQDTEEYLDRIDNMADRESELDDLKKTSPTEWAIRQHELMQEQLASNLPSPKVVNELMLRAVFYKLFPDFDLGQFKKDYAEGVKLRRQLKRKDLAIDREAVSLREREIRRKLRTAYAGDVRAYEGRGPQNG